MFKKNDPLVQSVQKVMQENTVRREVETKLCEELGIYSKRELPIEHHKNYDALLEQRIAEALHPNQQKLDVHEPEKDELTAHDFKMLRAMGKNKKKEMKEENDKSSSDPDMQAPRHPSQGGKKYDDEIKPKGKEKEPEMENMPEKTPVPPKRPAGLEESYGKKVAGAVLAKLRAKKMNEQEDDKPRFADGNKVTPLLSKLSDQEKKDYEKASAEVEKIRGKPIDFSKPADSAKSEPEKTDTEKPVKVAQAATGTASDAPSPAATTPKSGEFSSSRTPSGAKRLSADAVSDYEKETANRQRLNRASIESQKGELAAQKEYDAVMQQRNAYSKEREEKGIVPKKYRFESAGEINEKAPPGAKYERMIKHIKDKYKKGGLTKQEKSIAYATAWKAKNKEEKND